MNKLKNFKLIFFIILLLFSFLVILNYTVKSPNDGVLYLSSAFYFVENHLFIDSTRTMDEIIRPFPTTQIGITFFLILLIYLFKNFWIFFYIILLSLLWTILIKKLYYFSYNNFIQNKYLAFIVPFLIFFNYDYLIASSSFYNEALYYPFLIFSFLKIINCLKKNKNFFEKSFLFSIFLATGCIFRFQHFVFIASLAIFFLLYKKYKNFFLISIFGFINVFIFVITFNFLKNSVSVNELNILVENNSLRNIYLFFKNYFIDVYNALIYHEFNNYNLILKNIKTHLVSYTHFFNLPKLVDITLVNNGKSYTEFFYLIITSLVIFVLFKYFKNTKIDATRSFLIVYFILNSIFLFLMTDIISRYFLYTNFCVIFFLSDNFKFYKFNNSHKKYYFSLMFIFCLIIATYGFSYFQNYAIANKSPTFKILKMLKEFDHNRNNVFSEDEIFISRFNYQIKWVTDKASLNPKQFIDFHKKFNPKRKYFFVGTKNEFYKTMLPLTEPKVEYIENYLFHEVDNDEPSIWKIHLKM